MSIWNGDSTYIPTTNTKLYLKLNWDTTDSSGNGNNWTATNVSYVNWLYGKAWNFTGSSYIDCWIIPLTLPVTFYTWVNTNISSWYSMIIGCYTEWIDASTLWSISVNFDWTNINIYWNCVSNTFAFSNIWYPNTVTANKWYLATLMLKNWLQKLWVNGKLIWSTNVATLNNVTSTVPIRLWLASNWWTRFFPWMLDESFIELSEHSDKQVQEYYAFAKWRYQTTISN